jgi:hypothetical protein
VLVEGPEITIRPVRTRRLVPDEPRADASPELGDGTARINDEVDGMPLSGQPQLPYEIRPPQAWVLSLGLRIHPPY